MANIYITQELFENIILSMLEDMGCKTEIIEVPDNSESTRLLVKKGEKKCRWQNSHGNRVRLLV